MDVTRTKRHFDVAGRRSSDDPRFSITADGIQFQFIESNVPESVPPGTEFSGRFEIRISSAPGLSSPLDPDWCVAENLLGGVRADTSVRSGGSVLNTQTFCYPAPFAGGSGSRVINFSGIAPDQENTTFPLELTITGFGSGNELLNETYTIDVGEGGGVQPPCSTNDDCGDGFECRGGVCQPVDNGGGDWFPLPCFLDADKSCGSIQSLTYGALVIFLAFIVLARA